MSSSLVRASVGTAIGSPVTGASASGILYVDASGNLAESSAVANEVWYSNSSKVPSQNPNFTFDGTNISLNANSGFTLINGGLGDPTYGDSHMDRSFNITLNSNFNGQAWGIFDTSLGTLLEVYGQISGQGGRVVTKNNVLDDGTGYTNINGGLSVYDAFLFGDYTVGNGFTLIDDMGTPSNPVTPAGWIHGQFSSSGFGSGTDMWIPYYT